MINGDLASNILYTAAGALFVAAVVFAIIGELARRDHRSSFTPREQMRERTPWPPPPLPRESDWVTVAYDKPQRSEPLALPRGEG